jgi:hypothetical protein
VLDVYVIDHSLPSAEEPLPFSRTGRTSQLRELTSTGTDSWTDDALDALAAAVPHR